MSGGSTTPTGGGKQLTLKRSEEAPITLQGWLYKQVSVVVEQNIICYQKIVLGTLLLKCRNSKFQGSDGLMLWRKRWFVLSEFCLFYYKVSFFNNTK